MRAAVYKSEQVLQVEELPDPTPGPNQVVMRVKYSAICGTDVHAFLYDLAQPGAVMGHEYTGTIIDVGADVTRWKTGDHVIGGGGIRRRARAQRPARIRGSTTGRWASSTTTVPVAMPNMCCWTSGNPHRCPTMLQMSRRRCANPAR